MGEYTTYSLVALTAQFLLPYSYIRPENCQAHTTFTPPFCLFQRACAISHQREIGYNHLHFKCNKRWVDLIKCTLMARVNWRVPVLFIINLVQLPQLHNFIFKKHCRLTPVLECQNCSLKNRVLREGSFNMKGGQDIEGRVQRGGGFEISFMWEGGSLKFPKNSIGAPKLTSLLLLYPHPHPLRIKWIFPIKMGSKAK